MLAAGAYARGPRSSVPIPTDTTSTIQEAIGCTRVIAWNSTVRRNEPETVKFKEVERQKGPEENFIPTTRLQPVASVAHVDQDPVSLH
jgi:hypothetical protein